MHAAISNFLIEVGSLLTKSWGFSDSSGALDLEGYHARLQIRASVDAAGDPLLDADDAAIGGLVISGGTVTLTIPPEDSQAWDLSGLPLGPLQVGQSAAGVREVVQGYLAVYALELTPHEGSPVRVLQGQVAISPEVVHV